MYKDKNILVTGGTGLPRWPGRPAWPTGLASIGRPSHLSGYWRNRASLLAWQEPRPDLIDTSRYASRTRERDDRPVVANDRQIDLPGGTFLMGNEVGAYPSDGEGPVRPVHLSPFAISSTAVTTTEFAAFVDATGHKTLAEDDGWDDFDHFLEPPEPEYLDC